MLFILLGFFLGNAQADATAKKPNPPAPRPPTQSNGKESGMPADGVYLNSDGSPLLPLIQGTQRTLDIEIYTMDSPTVRAEMRAAISRGVKIRVIKDANPVGNSCDVFGTSSVVATGAGSTDCADQQKFVTEVKSSGGTYIPFNKSTLCPNGGGSDGQSCFEHGKIAIADGQIAMISTGNFDETSLCIASEASGQCDRDWSYITGDSTVVGTLENIYDSDIRGNSYDVRTLIPSSLKGTLTVSPYTLQPMLDFINSARTSIDIETQYLEDQEMNAALESAAKRGVKVSVVVASVYAFGKPSSTEASNFQKTYTTFDSDRIASSMFNASNLINGKAGYMHAKAIVVDDTRAWVGSANGSQTALTENREYGIFLDTPADVQKLLTQIQADHDSPDSESWQDSLNGVKDQSQRSS
jgi:phosphatidylserine/phosphatidylglycerophosphate/cardiolipin synthase-like enzyme